MNMEIKMTQRTPPNQLKWLKIAALFEGSSLIALLFVALPFKYLLGMPEVVSVVGRAHGGLFLVFIVVLVAHFFMKRISVAKVGVGMVASFIPFGTFVFSEKCLKGPAT